jgi:hypothetical protein
MISIGWFICLKMQLKRLPKHVHNLVEMLHEIMISLFISDLKN